MVPSPNREFVDVVVAQHAVVVEWDAMDGHVDPGWTKKNN